uniref:F-box domain-containing protein n=1 Tax=Oryza punctata TaxID=4537 RepID=A0A0E0MGY1_ORYPU
MAPELPQDILMDIFSLLEIPDLMRSSSVCTSWRSACTSLRRLGQYDRHQTPCLFYTSESDGDNVACLYHLAAKKVYRLTLPDPPIRRRHLIGSSHDGWLVTADERSELHMVNPITGEQVALPSVTTIEQVKPVVDDAGVILNYELSQYCGDMVFNEDPIVHTPGDLRDHLYFKAFVFSELSTGGYIVVIIHNPEHQLSFARVWRKADVAAGDNEEDAPEWDISKIVYNTKKVYVYKIDMEAKELVEIDGLNDHVLFLGNNQSQCLRAEEYPQLKANHVYFTDDLDGISLSFRVIRRDIGVLNLENNSREEIEPPQLWCGWPSPIWITPSLTIFGNLRLNK